MTHDIDAVVRGLTEAQRAITRIADVAEAIAAQAGIGGMETAGQIVSYLSANPQHIEDFIAGRTSPFDWPMDWFEHGRLTWHAMNGRIVAPQDLRRARLIKRLEKGNPDALRSLLKGEGE